MANPRPNPYSSFNFVVEIDQEEVAAFSEVTGLDSENTPIEYREGADATNAVRKLPGLETYPVVSLKRGITGHLTLWEWRREIRDGGTVTAQGKPVVIKLLDETGDRDNPAMTWTLTNAWPSKLTGPSLNATSSEIAIEQLDLCHDRLTIS